jgi:hypothetical protein
MVRTYRSYQHFHQEMLRSSVGPLSSAVEDIADEMFHSDMQEEFGAMWDASASDD